MEEFSIPKDQLEAFRKNKDACVIGRKLRLDKKLQLGDPLALKGDAYPVNLNLTIRGTTTARATATCGCASSASTRSTRRSSAS